MQHLTSSKRPSELAGVTGFLYQRTIWTQMAARQVNSASAFAIVAVNCMMVTCACCGQVHVVPFDMGSACREAAFDATSDDDWSHSHKK